MSSRVARKDRGQEVPAAIKGNDDAEVFYGLLLPSLQNANGRDLKMDSVAEIALSIIDIVKAHHIVDVWTNDVAQNNMRNAIDDYFFDELRDRKGMELPIEVMHELEQKIMDLARARFPG